MAIANSHCSMAGSNFLRITLRAAFCIGAAFSISGAGAQETTVREKIAAAIVIPDAGEQVDAILSLKKTPSPEIVGWLEKWKEGVIFIYEAPDGTIIPVLMGAKIKDTGKTAIRRLSDDKPLLDGNGAPIGVTKFELDMADTSSKLRKAMEEVSDIAALADPDLEKRIRAINPHFPALRSGLGRRSAAKTPPMALSGASRREQIPAVKLLRAPACGIIGKND
jgi:hypothetical protein